jgi:hypothetical protein
MQQLEQAPLNRDMVTPAQYSVMRKKDPADCDTPVSDTRLGLLLILMYVTNSRSNSFSALGFSRPFTFLMATYCSRWRP